MDIKARMAQVAQQDNGLGIILGGVPTANVQQVALEKLHPYANHTFQVRRDTEHYNAMTASIRDSGIQTPLLVRPGQLPGEYEIIAGHTRYSIARDLKLATVPCIVKAMSDPEATRLMVESNLQRTEWLPSERAKSYKAWLEAVREETGIRAGKPTDNCGTEFHNLKSRDVLAEKLSITGRSLDTYIKLNDLASPLLDLVDEGRITVKAGYQLAFLPPDVQRVVHYVISAAKATLKEEAALDLRFLAREQGRLAIDDVRDILRGGKGGEPKVKTVSFAVPVTPGMDTKTVKRLKSDEEFQAALAAWIEDYLKKELME